MDTCQKLLAKQKGINYFSDLMNWTNDNLNEWQNEVLNKELFDKTKTLQLQSGIDLDQVIYQIMNLGKARFIKINGYTKIVEEIGIENWVIAQKGYQSKYNKARY